MRLYRCLLYGEMKGMREEEGKGGEGWEEAKWTKTISNNIS